MPKEIPLTGGGFALVDDDMYDYLMQWNWYVSNNGYAVRGSRTPEGKYVKLCMHRAVLGLGTSDEDPIFVDHINGNKLDNRRENLRLSTNSQNIANSKIRADNSSGYKGVNFNKQKKKWRAQIQVNGKRHFIGYFDCKHKAARAYNEAAIKYFGEFAKLNEIHDDKERGA